MYPELAITLCNDGTLRAQTLAGEPTTGLPDLSVFREDFPRLPLEMIEDWLSSDSRDRHLRRLGKHLYQALFEGKDGKVAQVYREELEKVLNTKERLRIALSFEGKYRDYGSNPWEFLYDPGQDEYFALHENIALSRRTSSQADRKAADADGGTLQVLIVAFLKQSSTAEDSATASVNALKDAFDKLKLQTDFSYAQAINPPLTDFSRLVAESKVSKLVAESQLSKPHVLHVIAHGRYRRNGKVEVLLMMRGGEEVWHSGAQFADLIRKVQPSPRLVFLQLYEVAKSNEGGLYDSFAGLAPQLVSSGVHAVVGTQFPIKGEDAAKFSAAFYGEVLKGSTIAVAVETARELERSESEKYSSTRSFGTPVLYTDRHDTVLIRSSQRFSPQTPVTLPHLRSDAPGTPSSPKPGKEAPAAWLKSPVIEQVPEESPQGAVSDPKRGALLERLGPIFGWRTEGSDAAVLGKTMLEGKR